MGQICMHFALSASRGISNNFRYHLQWDISDYGTHEMILTSNSRVTSAPRPRWGRLWRGWQVERCCDVAPCFSNFRFNFSSFMLGYKWQIFSAVFIIHPHNEIQFLYNSTCALWGSFNSGNILFCQVQADLCAAQFSKRLSAIKMFIFSSPAL